MLVVAGDDETWVDDDGGCDDVYFSAYVVLEVHE